MAQTRGRRNRIQGRMKKTCGACKACCQNFNIEEINLKRGQRCKHITDKNGSKGRCSIYGTQARPAVCAGFECLYLKGLFERSDRPDKVGIMAYFSQLENGLVCLVAQELLPKKFISKRGKGLLEKLRSIQSVMEKNIDAPVPLVKHSYATKKIGELTCTD